MITKVKAEYCKITQRIRARRFHWKNGGRSWMESLGSILFWLLLYSPAHTFPAFTATALAAISEGTSSKPKSLALSLVFPVLEWEPPRSPANPVRPGRSSVSPLTPARFSPRVCARRPSTETWNRCGLCLSLSSHLDVHLSVSVSGSFPLISFTILFPSSFFLLLFCLQGHPKEEQQYFLIGCVY